MALMDIYDSIQSTSLEPIFDVIIRVPPLFIIDELLRLPSDLVGNGSDVFGSSLYQNSSISTFSQQLFLNCEDCHSYSMITLKIILSIAAFFAALIMFMLTPKHLVTVYSYLLTLGMIFFAYWTNIEITKMILNDAEQNNTTTIVENIISFNFTSFMQPKRIFLGIVCNYVLQLGNASQFYKTHFRYTGVFMKVVVSTIFTLPTLLFLYNKPNFLLLHAPVFCTLLLLVIHNFFIWSNFSSVMRILYQGYQYARTFVNNYGLSPLIETEWSRLNVPRVLRVFWLLRVAEQLVRMYYAGETFAFFTVLRSVLVNGCETLPALLGMTSVVSFICHYIGCFFQWVLLTDDEDEKSFGTISAVLFYILALQTGLTGLDHEKRFARLCKNFCLLFTAVLHFVHNLVNPLLMSLSASHNPALHKHLRALGVCAFLITFASSLLAFLWTHFTISTWLFAVSVFSIEVIVKVLVSLAIYSLFLFVAYRSTFWEQLDDCVYFIRSFGNTVEFAFGIVLFFNGSWILMFESGGAIRAIMMCIHAYFNLWCEARAGWNVFMKRRSAVNKINSLPEAKAEQLRRHDDVCAICYQEMCHAKITKCNHFFHAVCLRKWLYVQDRCPLCHDILYKVETPSDKCLANNNEEQQEQQAQPADEQVEEWLANR